MKITINSSKHCVKYCFVYKIIDDRDGKIVKLFLEYLQAYRIACKAAGCGTKKYVDITFNCVLIYLRKTIQVQALCISAALATSS